VAQQRVADLAVVVAGADDRDRRRPEQPGDRAGLAALLALVGDGEGVLGLLDRERQVHDAVLVGPLGLVAGVLEDAHHLAVLGQDLGHEVLDPAFPGGGGQVLEQDRAEASALVGVLDEEGDLGIVGSGVPVEAADRDDLIAQQHDEGHPVDVVDVGEPVQVLVREPLHGAEEPVVAGLIAAAVHQAGERLGVLGTDRAQMHRATVGGHDVGLPVGRRHRSFLGGDLLLGGVGRAGGDLLSHGDRPGRGRSRGTPRAGCA
jgi:hypothetical protein